ncbi:MAG TPA: AarF/UbiB family protein [Pseudomonadales bacterium]|nr:AarF/UbiB family protein [Pseudomonadales bacterium]
MSLKDIKKGRWSRQWHLANAGFKAGLGLAGGHLRTLGLPASERDAAREDLLREQAQAWVAELGQLKGSIVKIGQILATYADYCLPAAIADALHQLEADTEAVAWSRMAPLVEQALGDQQKTLIIETTPLAAASLAQVHRARRKADGAHLCLKILYPGIRETLNSDLAVVTTGLLWWLPKDEQANVRQWLVTVRNVLQEELDLALEEKKLQRWHKRLLHDRRYIVPVVAREYCSGLLLAMSYETGVVQHDPSVLALSQTRRNQLGINVLELFLREVLVWGEMQTDPHPGNYRIRLDEGKGDQIVLLDFGSVRKIEPQWLSPLRHMIVSAYRGDADALLDAVCAAGLLDASAPDVVKHDFTAVLLGMMEPLNYRAKLADDPHSVPAYAMDTEGNYQWAHAQLPKRMGKQALHSATSRYFVFPGADFMLLSRKLAGVYAFIASLDARFDASPVMEKVLQDADAQYRVTVS